MEGQKRSLEERETRLVTRPSEELPRKKLCPSSLQSPPQVTDSWSALEQEPTEPSPQTWRASNMFALVLPINTDAPDAGAQDSFPS